MEMNLMNYLNKKTDGDLEGQIDLLKTHFEQISNKGNVVLQEAVYYDEDIDEESEGFLLKLGEKEIFYSISEQNKALTIKMEEGDEFDYEDLLTLSIVHDVHMDITQVNVRKLLDSGVSDLDEWLYSFLRVIESGFFICPFVDYVDSEIEDFIEESYDVLVLSPSTSDIDDSAEPKQVEEDEEVKAVDEEVVNEEDVGQLSFFPSEVDEEEEEEEPFSVGEVDELFNHNQPSEDKSRKEDEANSESVGQLVVPSDNETKPNTEKESAAMNLKAEQNIDSSSTGTQVSLDTLKEKRPDIFDDSWVDGYLKKFDLGEEHNKYVGLVTNYRKYRREKYENNPEALLFVSDLDSLYQGYDDVLRKSISSIVVDTNLLLTGETSTGKTTLMETLSKLLNIPIFTINGSRDLNIETLIGFKDLEGGDIHVRSGGLIRAMELGGMLYVDEANLILPSVLGIAHGALDHRKTIYNELTGEIVEADKDFLVTSSINDRYEDTVEMNKATKDRFVAIEMTYMTKEHLINLLEGFEGFGSLQKELFDTDISTADIWTLTDIASALQEAVKSEQVSPEVASIRNILDLLKLTRILSWEDAIMMIVEKYSQEERHNIVAALQDVERIDINIENIIDGVVRPIEEVV